MTELVRFTPPVMEDGAHVTEFTKTVLRYADGRTLSDAKYLELYHSYLNDYVEAGYLRRDPNNPGQMVSTKEVRKLPYESAKQIMDTVFPAPLDSDYKPGSYGYQEYVDKIKPIVEESLIISSKVAGLVRTKMSRTNHSPGIVSLVGLPITIGGFVPVSIFGTGALWTAGPGAIGLIAGITTVISGLFWLGEPGNKVDSLKVTKKGDSLLEELNQYDRALTAGGNYVTSYESAHEKRPRLTLSRKK